MFCPECLFSGLGLKPVSVGFRHRHQARKVQKKYPFFASYTLLQPCEHTQLDFMAEQCSQTDLHPLYLLPNTASFYTWIPAVGFAQGGPRENFSICTGTKPLSLHIFYCDLFSSKPGDEQCRYMCQSDGENFIVSRGAQFVDGTRCESDSLPPFGSTAACLRGKCQVEMTK